MRTYKTVAELIEAKDNGNLPGSFALILDNDDVHGYGGGNSALFRSDPHSLLRELLDYVGLPYDEA